MPKRSLKLRYVFTQARRPAPVYDDRPSDIIAEIDAYSLLEAIHEFCKRACPGSTKKA
jgi:hypothetical protein